MLGVLRKAILQWSKIFLLVTYGLMAFVWGFSVVNPPGSDRYVRKGEGLHINTWQRLTAHMQPTGCQSICLAF